MSKLLTELGLTKEKYDLAKTQGKYDYEIAQDYFVSPILVTKWKKANGYEIKYGGDRSNKESERQKQKKRAELILKYTAQGMKRKEIAERLGMVTIKKLCGLEWRLRQKGFLPPVETPKNSISKDESYRIFNELRQKGYSYEKIAPYLNFKNRSVVSTWIKNMKKEGYLFPHEEEIKKGKQRRGWY